MQSFKNLIEQDKVFIDDDIVYIKLDNEWKTINTSYCINSKLLDEKLNQQEIFKAALEESFRELGTDVCKYELYVTTSKILENRYGKSFSINEFEELLELLGKRGMLVDKDSGIVSLLKNWWI